MDIPVNSGILGPILPKKKLYETGRDRLPVFLLLLA